MLPPSPQEQQYIREAVRALVLEEDEESLSFGPLAMSQWLQTPDRIPRINISDAERPS